MVRREERGGRVDAVYLLSPLRIGLGDEHRILSEENPELNQCIVSCWPRYPARCED